MATLVPTSDSLTFLYQGLPKEAADALHEHSREIRLRTSRLMADVVEIGRRLALVQQLLHPKRFREWYELELGMKQRSVQRYVSIARKFGDDPRVERFDFTAAVTMASGNTPPAAVKRALAMAGRGKRVTATTAAKIVSEYQQDKPTNTVDESRMLYHLRTTIRNIATQWPADRRDRLCRHLTAIAAELAAAGTIADLRYSESQQQDT